MVNESTSSIPQISPLVSQQKRSETSANESRNFLVLMIFHVQHRLAWIFKTETVIMPAFLDAIAGSGTMRGWLPILSRFGQSVPPILVSSSLRRTPRKSKFLMISTLGMSGCFLLIAVGCLYLTSGNYSWFPILFLFIYTVFFSATGINQLSFNTLQGKLIKPERRGRLMGLAGIFGSILAISAALLLLSQWLLLPFDQCYSRIFGITGLLFLSAVLTLLFIREHADDEIIDRHHQTKHIQEMIRVVRDDRNYRRTIIVGMLANSALLLTPHYQWLGREFLDLAGKDLMWWVIIQNACAGTLSLVVGFIADRFGYRLVLRMAIFSLAIIPFMAYFWTHVSPETGQHYFWLTYGMLGLFPVTIKSFHNYVLEIAPPMEHPRYLSTLTACMAIPFLFSPLIGYLMDSIPVTVLLFIGVLNFFGMLGTFFIQEPRAAHDGVHL